MTNNVTNLVPTNDPVFRADPQLDPPVKVMACIEEHELCNPNLGTTGNCRNFTPIEVHYVTTGALSLNRRQEATALRTMLNLIGSDIGNIASLAPGDVVSAGRTVFESVQYRTLANDHWRAELKRWFAMTLYLIQSDAVQTATPQLEPSLQDYFRVIRNDTITEDCKCQRFRSAAGVRNFNFLAIILILSVGIAIITTATFIEPIMGAIRRVCGVDEYRMLAWVFDGTLQLQRLAYGAAGVGSWKPGASDVPTSDDKSWPMIDLKEVATAESVYGPGGTWSSATSPIIKKRPKPLV